MAEIKKHSEIRALHPEWKVVIKAEIDDVINCSSCGKKINYKKQNTKKTRFSSSCTKKIDDGNLVFLNSIP